MQSKGYLLIADISGYTDFIRLHSLREKPIVGSFAARMFESHAEIIISDLLVSVIDAIEPVMQLNKLEGDAAFFYCDEVSKSNQADQIINVMQSAQSAFQKKAKELLFVEACGCEPCTQAKNLRLKMVVHNGAYTHQKIRNFEELAGEAVIFVHRLLKNSIQSDEYWLLSKEFSKQLSEETELEFSEITEKIGDFGRVKLDLKLMNSENPKNEIISKRGRIVNWFCQASYFSKATLHRKLKKNKAK